MFTGWIGSPFEQRHLNVTKLICNCSLRAQAAWQVTKFVAVRQFQAITAKFASIFPSSVNNYGRKINRVDKTSSL